jgi:hypothetical protein
VKKIKLLTPLLFCQYSDFLNKQKAGLFYYSIKFKQFLEEVLKCNAEYYVVTENNNISAILPTMSKKGKYGKVINSLPFYGSHGGILYDDVESFDMLLKFYSNRIIVQSGTASSVLINNPLMEADYSRISYDLIDERIGQFTYLDCDDKQKADKFVFGKIHSKTRNMIRKAIKCNIKVEISCDEMEFLKVTHKENMIAIEGKSKKDVFFDKINDYFVKNQDYKIYLATYEGEKVAALLLFYYNGCVEYFTPVIVQEFRSYQPLSLLIFQAMIDAIKSGYNIWNWGGTWLSQKGVYKFKKKWGVIDKKYFHYINIANKELFCANKRELVNEYDDFYVIPFDKLQE